MMLRRRYCSHNKTPATPATEYASKRRISFDVSSHLRERCEQRDIKLHQLQDAMRYGTKELHGAENRYKYTYEGISLIYNQAKNEGVTCYEEPSPMQEKTLLGASSTTVGKVRMGRWTSHKVIVVDTSASMRKADVARARTRLALVWQIIATDLIRKPLLSGSATCTDMVTIVIYGLEASILLKERPCDWTLYNELVRIYNTNSVVPGGHKKFLPALDLAKTLLTRNMELPYPRELYFLSDGTLSQIVPAEEESMIALEVGKLALRLKGRFRLTAVGIGHLRHFHVLDSMVTEAKRCGAVASSLIAARDRKSVGWCERLLVVEEDDKENDDD